MERGNIQEILQEHALWLRGEPGGRRADLRGANLRGASLSEAHLPSPQMVLLAEWGELSEGLTLDLMRYNAASHPEGPGAFDTWARGGPHPYENCPFQRGANFRQEAPLWVRGPSKSPASLAGAILDEKCPGWRG